MPKVVSGTTESASSIPRSPRRCTRGLPVTPTTDGFILTNGYDWTYFRVDDAPFTVRSLRLLPDAVMLSLSDETEEALVPEMLRVGRDDALYAKVKGGAFEARFSRHAQTSLAPALDERTDGKLELRLGGHHYPLP